MGQDLSSAAGRLQCGQMLDHVPGVEQEFHIAEAGYKANRVPSQDSTSTTSSSDEEFYTPKSCSSKAGSSDKTVIIFDWDDTLLCSTAVKQRFGGGELQHLAELEEAAARILEAAQTLGEVLIVTNGNEHWIMESARRVLPGLVPTLEKIQCISARHMYERDYPGDAFMWKRAAFRKLLLEERSQGDTKLNLIALGDQMPEIEAARFVGRQLGQRCRVKTIKLHEQPSVGELVGQLRRLREEIGRVVAQEQSCGMIVKCKGLAKYRYGESSALQGGSWKLSRESGRSVMPLPRKARVSLPKVGAGVSIRDVWPLLS